MHYATAISGLKKVKLTVSSIYKLYFFFVNYINYISSKIPRARLNQLIKENYGFV
jgi:hypothetical protein